MTRTLTGNLPIGFRQGGWDWMNNPDTLLAFARDERFEAIDVRVAEVDLVRKVAAAGLHFGTVDLPQPWTALASPDAAERRDAAQKCAQFVRDAAALGARNFFVVVIPKDFAAPRKDNLDRAADGYGQLCRAVASLNVRIAIEGWPGPGPHYPCLACTPEGYRALFNAVGSNVLAVNFDPSHLIRMDIEPARFLAEFVDRVAHVHAKDTLILEEELYQFGNLQPATLVAPHKFGQNNWRYTIPGHGSAPWKNLLAMLVQHGYKGAVSIELEDENYMNTEADQKRGFIASRDFLIHL